MTASPLTSGQETKRTSEPAVAIVELTTFKETFRGLMLLTLKKSLLSDVVTFELATLMEIDVSVVVPRVNCGCWVWLSREI